MSQIACFCVLTIETRQKCALSPTNEPATVRTRSPTTATATPAACTALSRPLRRGGGRGAGCLAETLAPACVVTTWAGQNDDDFGHKVVSNSHAKNLLCRDDPWGVYVGYIHFSCPSWTPHGSSLQKHGVSCSPLCFFVKIITFFLRSNKKCIIFAGENKSNYQSSLKTKCLCSTR